jgi:hypothetical protein
VRVCHTTINTLPYQWARCINIGGALSGRLMQVCCDIVSIFHYVSNMYTGNLKCPSYITGRDPIVLGVSHWLLTSKVKTWLDQMQIFLLASTLRIYCWQNPKFVIVASWLVSCHPILSLHHSVVIESTHLMIYRIYSNIRQKFFPDSSSKKWGVIL